MKKILFRLFIANALLIFSVISAKAQTTYVWTGATSSDWATPGNWTVNGGPAGDYPGHVGNTDIVDIGVPGVAGPADTTFRFTNQPVLASGTINIASLTFGNNNTPTGTITLNADGSTTTNTTAGIITLTVGTGSPLTATINVSGTVLQMHSPTGGGANSGTTTPAKNTPGTTTTAQYTSLLGNGTLHCGYFTVGDNTLPKHDEVSNVTVLLIGGIVTNLNAVAPHTITNPVESNIIINIDHDFTMNTISYSNPAGTQVTGPPNPTYQVVISRNSDARVLFYQGTINIGGMFSMLNNNATPAAGFKLFQRLYKPQNKFSIRPESDPGMPTSNWVTHPANFLYGGPFITFGNPSDPDYLNCVNKIDFYDNSGGISTGNAIANTNVNTSVVNYNGNNDQVVYSDSDTTHVDIGAFTYSQLIISGSGTKTVRPNGNYTPALSNPGLTVNQTLTVKNSGTGTPTVFDLLTNNANLWESGAYTTTVNSTVKSGTGYIFFMTGGYVNNGTSIFGPGLVTYNTGSNTANFSGNGTTYYTNVKFNNGSTTDGTIYLSSFGSTGTYYINSTGVMQLAQHGPTGNPTQFNQTVSVANPTTNAPGNAKLIFLSDANGSATLATLPGTCKVIGNGSNISVQRYIPGGSVAARGYRLISSPVYTNTVGTNNVYSINYLINSTFISGTSFPNTATTKNGNPSLYLYRENLAPTFNSFLTSNYRGIKDYTASPSYTIDIDGSGFNIPTGNGYLFYFRGGLTTATPFTAGSSADAGTLTATGYLNQGNITVVDWYTPTSTNLGYTTVSGSAGIEGTNLVGNPYPAAIDWNTYSATNASAGIYAPNVTQFIYELRPGSAAGAGNYAVYGATAGTTNGGTNIIASGQGFFVQALNNNAQLTFTENAKVNTSPGPAVFLAKLPATAKVTRQYMRLKMALDTINSDETYINFDSNSSAAFDPHEDALYKVGTGKVNLASYTSNHSMVAINSTPLVGKGQIIPLKINASANGTYTFNASEISGIPAQFDIWLKDNFTKDSVDLRKNPSYSLTITLSDTTTYLSKRLSIMISQNPALAYKLTSFEGDKVANKQQAELKWTTANELNNTKFVIERSTDNGKTFNDIDSLVSNGSGSYSYVDKGANKGDNLYRLKSQDFVNTITLSDVVDVKVADNGGNNSRVCVYPNPAVNHIVLTIDPKYQDQTSFKIKITNSYGLVVAQATVSDTNWENNISRLMTGTYLVQVVSEKDNSLIGQAKFVKL